MWELTLQPNANQPCWAVVQVPNPADKTRLPESSRQLMSLQVLWSIRESDSAYTSIPQHGDLHPTLFPNHEDEVSSSRSRSRLLQKLTYSKMIQGELRGPALDIVKSALASLIEGTKAENADALSR